MAGCIRVRLVPLSPGAPDLAILAVSWRRGSERSLGGVGGVNATHSAAEGRTGRLLILAAAVL